MSGDAVRAYKTKKVNIGDVSDGISKNLNHCTTHEHITYRFLQLTHNQWERLSSPTNIHPVLPNQLRIQCLICDGEGVPSIRHLRRLEPERVYRLILGLSLSDQASGANACDLASECTSENKRVTSSEGYLKYRVERQRSVPLATLGSPR